MTLIQFPESLEGKLGREGASDLIELLNTRENQQLDYTIEQVEDKFEKRLTEEISSLEKRILEKFDSHIRWMIGLWLTQMLGIFGILGSIIMLLIQRR